MAVRISLVLYFFISAAIACAAVGQAGSSTFAGDNLIRQVVSDGGLHDEVENAILQVIGSTPRALSFARFALKYGKRYESPEEMKRRFSVFKESLKTIRSHNNRGLSYKLGVNEFADITWDEFRTQRLGAAQNCSATSKGKRLEARWHHKPNKKPRRMWSLLGIQGAEDELLYAVGMIRPVSVAFQAVDGFNLYKSGVYISTICRNTSMDLNHAVLAVGYGVENGVQYWLLKNSWGDQWGENGYFKMQMGKNMCGIATCASYPIVA
nr:cysteine proteinase 3-like [Ipomoea batatas]